MGVETINDIRPQMLAELTRSFTNVRQQDVQDLIREIVQAKRVFIYGLGRERLMLQAFGMRLMHLGIHVHIVGDVTTPAIQAGDLWITSSGTGRLATVEALMNIVKDSAARVAFFTAFPEASLPRRADLIIPIPAQTMREGVDGLKSIQPMGSLFEQTQLLLFDWIVVLLAERLRQTEASMAGRHTNLE
ncbi:6-phospho-3-hexuloisomerase [Cohnella cholangitidis]|uniref:SIS domain-containing protein n=1 Tax=Cohnella cholangitidis TaxID=2598458 RepID=A0A7G5C0J7_9BACL|nr:6-phospho-3-hexuloisomerase [Cohnella cholangitidis]QMV42731.1 SIS domain-containing protein [Cohnella cholangitidis]